MCRVVEIVKAGGIERTQGAGVNTGKARLTTSAQARAIGAGVNGMERGRNTMATEGAGKGNVRAGVGGTAKAGGITTTCCFFVPPTRFLNFSRQSPRQQMQKYGINHVYMKVPPKAK